MKQTFTIEIETLNNQSTLRDFQIMAALKNSFDEFFDGNARPLSAKETNVEQNHGTPKSIDKNALDLLRRASDSFKGLAPHCEEEILGEIEDYLELIKDKQ